jgi:hypothetical protein
MTALANVAITDTFDTLRIRVNQIVEKGNEEETKLTNSYNKANSANVLAFNTGIGANAFAAATIAGANTRVGTGANAYAAAIANTISLAAFNKANAALANTTGAVFSGSLIISDNLTIGTATSPDHGLAISKPAGVSAARMVVTTANTTFGSYADIAAYSKNGAEYTQIASLTDSIGALVFNSGVAGYIYTLTSTPLIFLTGLNERMRITPSGNVSIGSVIASATLDVSGSVSFAKANVLAQTLTDAATINWDTSLGQVATVTLGGNRIFAAPTNLRVGTYVLHVIQDGGGGRTITWNSVFKWPNGTPPVLTTTASRRDLLTFVSDGTNLYGTFLADVR